MCVRLTFCWRMKFRWSNQSWSLDVSVQVVNLWKRNSKETLLMFYWRETEKFTFGSYAKGVEVKEGMKGGCSMTQITIESYINLLGFYVYGQNCSFTQQRTLRQCICILCKFKQNSFLLPINSVESNRIHAQLSIYAETSSLQCCCWRCCDYFKF